MAPKQSSESNTNTKPESDKMDTSPPSTTTPSTAPPPASATQLGVLEEDDEFEEFSVSDWDDAQTDLAHLGGGKAPGAAKSGGDKLWEDNWDDDDVEDEFSMQLRNEIAKKSGGGGDEMES